MAPTNSAAPTMVDAAGNVVGDVPCRRCSYNLRGLNYSGRCPECGTAVGQSIYGNLLRFSDPQWVDKLARGVNLILWGIVALIASFIVGMVVGRGDPMLTQVIGFLGGLVELAGAWLLTEPDPGTQEQPQTISARRLVRFLLIVGVFHSLLSMITPASMHPMLSIAMASLLFVAACVGVVGQFAQIYYLEKIALRIPDQKLAARARLVLWGFGIPLAVLTLMGALMMFTALSMKQIPGAGRMPIILTFSCVGGLAALAALVFGILYLIMLFQFNRVLKEQSDYARSTWAMMNAPAGMAPPPIAGQV